MEIKTTKQIYKEYFTYDESIYNNSMNIDMNLNNIEWVRVDSELIDLVKDVIVYYNKEYQKHPFNKTHQKCMNALKILDELSQSNKGECPLCHNKQEDNYMCKKCIPKYNREAYKSTKRQEKLSQSNKGDD